jgi:hypothetical protein
VGAGFVGGTTGAVVGGTTTVVPGTDVGCGQPSLQVMTEVTVIVLVEVTG